MQLKVLSCTKRQVKGFLILSPVEMRSGGVKFYLPHSTYKKERRAWLEQYQKKKKKKKKDRGNWAHLLYLRMLCWASFNLSGALNHWPDFNVTWAWIGLSTAIYIHTKVHALMFGVCGRHQRLIMHTLLVHKKFERAWYAFKINNTYIYIVSI